MSVFCNGTCASEGSVKNRVESEFKWCKVHLSLPSDRFFPLMCMFVCVCVCAEGLMHFGGNGISSGRRLVHYT